MTTPGLRFFISQINYIIDDAHVCMPKITDQLQITSNSSFSLCRKPGFTLCDSRFSGKEDSPGSVPAMGKRRSGAGITSTPTTCDGGYSKASPSAVVPSPQPKSRIPVFSREE
jgi:hypothetical protein